MYLRKAIIKLVTGSANRQKEIVFLHSLSATEISRKMSPISVNDIKPVRYCWPEKTLWPTNHQFLVILHYEMDKPK